MSKTGFEWAKDFIEKAGFSHIKLEMEADLDRRSSSVECDECYGEGANECHECTGSGIVTATRPSGTEIDVECDECYGEGSIECDECDGEGETEGEYWDEESCEMWIRNYVSDGARQALTYAKFYYDGSVDSEMTLTLPVSKAEYMIEFMEAFKALSEEIGNGLETGGAGLHICVIPKEARGNYPAGRYTLNRTKYRNFESEVTKLLPALYLLASPNETSRDLQYRYPRVCDEEKYSAIYSDELRHLEYRIFETCYDNPEMVKEYVEVIAKTLRFYHNPQLKVKSLGKTFEMTNDFSSREVKRFYRTPDSIKILRKQLQYIKPEGKTVHELLASRGVPSVLKLRDEITKNRLSLIKAYEDEKKRREVILAQPLTDNQKREMEAYIAYGHSEERANLLVRGLSTLGSLSEFIRERSGYSRREWSVLV